MKGMRIGRLAAATGVKVDTVRYYERNGLLAEPQREASGYRVYDQSALQRMRFIRSAQQLGFTLAEVRELLRLVDTSGDRAQVRTLAETRLADIDDRLRRLQGLRETLAQLVDSCRGHGDLKDCPIIEAVVDDADKRSST